jgi:signal transduction histidine kinase
MVKTAFLLPRGGRSLSARLLWLTILFVMISEVLIYVPSIARYRSAYLEETLAEAYLAIVALDVAPGQELSTSLEHTFLEHAHVLAIKLLRPQAKLMLGRVPTTDLVFDLRKATPISLIREAFRTLAMRGEQVIQIIGTLHHKPDVLIAVFLEEKMLYEKMYHYSQRILILSIIISLITAGFVYLSLQWLLVRPMRHITKNLIEFREAPEDHTRVIVPTRRSDEIGVMQRELERMQNELRMALEQKNRLAALGTAVGKISHDLRNILATTMLASESLARIPDPAVQRLTPLLVGSVHRASELCTHTLDLARGNQPITQRRRFNLHPLVDEVGESLGLKPSQGVRWDNQVDPTLQVNADHDRLFRVLMNLGRNAVQALGNTGNIAIIGQRVEEGIQIEITDDGPGVPEEVRLHLFEPFAGSANSGGIGLGLATARDLMRAHGGDLSLVETSSAGTRFSLFLPDS